MKPSFLWIPEKGNDDGAKNDLTQIPVPRSKKREGPFQDGIKFLRFGVVFLLCSLLAGMGSSTYMFLRNAELSMFKTQYQTSTSLIRQSVLQDIAKKVNAAALVNNLYQNSIDNNFGGTFPNFTFPGFETTMASLASVADLTFIAYSPLITTTNRKQFEAYATKHVYLLKGPPSLNRSVAGSWTVANGISNRTSMGGKSVDTGYNPASPYPTNMFPIWQISPIKRFASSVMVNYHASSPLRVKAIDSVIAKKKAVFTDFLKFLGVGPTAYTAYHPSTVLYGPILGLSAGSPLLGVFSGGFVWDGLFANITLDSLMIVISTDTSQYSWAVGPNGVTFLGLGDYHDSKFSGYQQSFPIAGSPYVLSMYPTKDLYNKYLTNRPANVCIIVVFIIFFVLAYAQLLKVRERRLTEDTKHAFASSAAREAALLAKKVYVRYISHEMRTPLNSTFMGLKLLEIELSKNMSAFSCADCTDTLRDVRKSCDMVLNILNDLLNYDKLEDGQMALDTKRISVLPFIIESVNSLLLQGREKNVQLLFDADENFFLDPYRNRWRNNKLVGRSHTNINGTSNIGGTQLFDINEDYENSCHDQNDGEIRFDSFNSNNSLLSSVDELDYRTFLDSNDYVEADEKKLNQVIRNLISNAIKFSPAGKNVIVRIRKAAADIFQRDSDDVSDGKKSRNLTNIARSKSFMSYSLGAAKKTHSDTASQHSSTKGKIWPNAYRQIKKFAMPAPRKVSFNSGSHSMDNSQYGRDLEAAYHANESENSLAFYPFGALILEVIDEGVGMASEDYKKLFKSVVQFNPNELQAGGGSGLGMIITKGIVDLHLGNISAYSAGLGKGSVFTLTLPLCRNTLTECPTPPSSAPLVPPLGLPPLGLSPLGTTPLESTPDRTPECRSPEHQRSILQETVTRSLEEGSEEEGGGARTVIEEVRNPDNASETEVNRKKSFARKVSEKFLGKYFDKVAIAEQEPRKLRFLVVDDSMMNRKMLCKLLTSDGHVCVQAEDGLEAVEWVKANMAAQITSRLSTDPSESPESPAENTENINSSERSNDDDSAANPCPNSCPVLETVLDDANHLDAILMDFMMPNMDGPSATKVIREMGFTRPIIGVTGNALPSDIEHFKVNGANEVVLKPLTMASLTAALRSFNCY